MWSWTLATSQMSKISSLDFPVTFVSLMVCSRAPSHRSPTDFLLLRVSHRGSLNHQTRQHSRALGWSRAMTSEANVRIAAHAKHWQKELDRRLHLPRPAACSNAVQTRTALCVGRVAFCLDRCAVRSTRAAQPEFLRNGRWTQVGNLRPRSGTRTHRRGDPQT